jgi:hypothetical protein
MNELELKKRRDLMLTSQCIRISLFVYVYVRVCKQEVSVLNSFLNPLFFLLDGMAFGMLDNDIDGPHMLYRTFRRFIVPYYFLAFLLLIAEVSFAPMEGVTLDGAFFLNRIVYDILPEIRTYSLWYLPSLFWSEMFCYIIIRLTKDRIPFSLCLVGLMLAWALIYNYFFHNFLFWSMDTAFIGSVYLYFGYLLVHKKMSKVFDFLFQNKLVSLFFFFVLTIVTLFGSLAIYRYCDESAFSGTQALYSPYQYVIPLTFVGMMAILFLAHAIENVVMEEIGKMTMVLLAIEQEIGIKLYRYFVAKSWYLRVGLDKPFDPEEMLCAIVGTLFIVAISIPVYYLFMYSPICVIFNKKWTKKKLRKA